MNVMRKMGSIGRFPVEMIGRAMVNSRAGKWVTAKVRKMIEQTEGARLRVLCIVLIAAMLIGDTIILLRPGGGVSGAAPAYSVMRRVRPAGAKMRPPEGKGFGLVWDSLLADPETKSQWDSLLRVRPGLQDTVRWLKRMDSAEEKR